MSGEIDGYSSSPDVSDAIRPDKCGGVKKPPGFDGRVEILLKSAVLFKRILPGS